MAHKYLTIDPLGEATATRRYKIDEKIFSLKNSYTIKDELDQPVLNVRAKLTLGDNLFLEDMTGNGLIHIHEELLHLRITYKILSLREGENGRELAMIKQKFSLHEKWLVNSIYGEYKVEALDLLGHSLRMIKEGKVTATIKRKYLTTNGCYELEIDDAEDQAFIIALVIILNQALYY
ncbi:hypothetical protein I4U23_026164 [Adineta vaga]|nr:hypothetical protein I4U23_026164 [Adineta vaga]